MFSFVRNGEKCGSPQVGGLQGERVDDVKEVDFVGAQIRIQSRPPHARTRKTQ